MPYIEVYSTPNCSFCDSAKALLKSKNLSFEEIDVSDDLGRLQEMVRLVAYAQCHKFSLTIKASAVMTHYLP